MNIRLCAVLAVFSLFVNLAWAEPVYLECQSGEKREFSVKLDEGNGKITHTNKDGDVFNAEGYFSANTVTYKLIRVNPTGKTVNTFSIDRTSLAFVSEMRVDFSGIKAEPVVIPSDGVCSIRQVKNRKF